MTEPVSMDAYVERFMANQRASGFGFDVTQHFPCPFCAAADWFVVKIADFAPPQEPGTYRSPETTCGECGRSGQFVSTRDSNGGVTAEMVQTGGDDPPDWLQPAPRREAA